MIDNKAVLTIPQDFEAEQAVLGAIILDNKLISMAAEILTPNSFHAEPHRYIFRAMVELSEKNSPIDEIILGDELAKFGKLEAIGGYGYLTELVESTPSVLNFEYYAKIIKEDAVLRDLINTMNDIGRKGRDPQQSVDDLLSEAHQKITEISAHHVQQSYRQLKHVLKDNFEDLERRSESNLELTGIPTGFTDIDKLTLGMQPSDLIVLGARPSMGKTALALNIAKYVATRTDEKGAILIFSLEMSDTQLGSRFLSSESKIDSRKLRSGNLLDGDWDNMAMATDRLSTSQIFINDTVGLTPSKMSAISRRINNEHEHGVSMIILDYLQLMESDKKMNSREQEISQISRACKCLAKELNKPFLLLSQLNRGLEKRPDKRPELYDLRESGSIEQDADIIWFIYRDEVYNEDSEKKGTAEILMKKHRNGPLGDIELLFEGKYTSFYNMNQMRF